MAESFFLAFSKSSCAGLGAGIVSGTITEPISILRASVSRSTSEKRIEPLGIGWGAASVRNMTCRWSALQSKSVAAE